MPAKKTTTDKPTGIVQLDANFRGHQAGETFTAAQAQKLGLEKSCRPFVGQQDRELKQSDKTG